MSHNHRVCQATEDRQHEDHEEPRGLQQALQVALQRACEVFTQERSSAQVFFPSEGWFTIFKTLMATGACRKNL